MSVPVTFTRGRRGTFQQPPPERAPEPLDDEEDSRLPVVRFSAGPAAPPKLEETGNFDADGNLTPELLAAIYAIGGLEDSGAISEEEARAVLKTKKPNPRGHFARSIAAKLKQLADRVTDAREVCARAKAVQAKALDLEAAHGTRRTREDLEEADRDARVTAKRFEQATAELEAYRKRTSEPVFRARLIVADEQLEELSDMSSAVDGGRDGDAKRPREAGRLLGQEVAAMRALLKNTEGMQVAHEAHAEFFGVAHVAHIPDGYRWRRMIARQFLAGLKETGLDTRELLELLGIKNPSRDLLYAVGRWTARP